MELVLVRAGFFLWERVRSSCWTVPMLEVRVAFVWYEWRVPAGLEVWSCIVWQGGAEVRPRSGCEQMSARACGEL